MYSESQRRLAVLVDGDNAQPKLLGDIQLEASRHGKATVRRIYGDWTKDTMKAWHDEANKHAFHAVNQLNYTVGKNATDSLMIIEAMDILHSGTVDGFCIVSSDSDFTGLAKRIREQGIFVMGIGKMSTPQSFRNACEVFTFVENISNEGYGQETPSTPHGKERPAATAGSPGKSHEWARIVKNAMDMIESDSEWFNLADIGNQIKRIDPSFDPRTYGRKKLSDLIKTGEDYFEIRDEGKGGPSTFYVRSTKP